MEWGGTRSRYMPFKRQNNSHNWKNRAGSRKAAKKNRKFGTGGCTTAWSVLPLFWTPRFGACLVHVLCLGSSVLGLLGLICNLPWSSRPSTSFFLLLLGSIYVNLKLKIPNKPNKRSRRNKGASHKIKHINPQEWVLNTQLIHAFMTVIKLPHA